MNGGGGDVIGRTAGAWRRWPVHPSEASLGITRIIVPHPTRTVGSSRRSKEKGKKKGVVAEDQTSPRHELQPEIDATDLCLGMWLRRVASGCDCIWISARFNVSMPLWREAMAAVVGLWDGVEGGEKRRFGRGGRGACRPTAYCTGENNARHVAVPALRPQTDCTCRIRPPSPPTTPLRGLTATKATTVDVCICPTRHVPLHAATLLHAVAQGHSTTRTQLGWTWSSMARAGNLGPRGNADYHACGCAHIIRLCTTM